MTQTVELRNGIGDKDRRRFWLLLVLMILIPPFVLLLPRYGVPTEWPWRELAETFLPPYKKQYSPSSILLAVCLVLVVYFATIWRGSRLLIGPDGISHESGLPRWFRFLVPVWSYRWDEITLRPAVERIVMPGHAWLVVDAGVKQHRLQMLGWHRTDGKRYESTTELRQRVLRLMSVQQSTETALKRSALLNTLSEFNVQLAPSGRQKDALERVKGGMTLAYITIGGISLGTIGMMLPVEKFIFGIPWSVVVSVGMAGAFVTSLAITRWMYELNVGEKLILPILVGGALAFASIPGLELLNAATANGPMRTVAFEQQADLTLVPIDAPDVPTMRLARYNWYWWEFERGHVHEIGVRQGGLGFWAYDFHGLLRQIRERKDDSRQSPGNDLK